MAVQAAKAAFSRNNGELWARATGKVRAGYLRAIAAKVNQSNFVPGPRILASSFITVTTVLQFPYFTSPIATAFD